MKPRMGASRARKVHVKPASDTDLHRGIWWLLERDLRCWVAVLKGYKDSKLEVMPFLYPRLGHGGYEYVLRTDNHELVVEKITEKELLAWWQTIVDITGCTWDEPKARAEFNHLIFLYQYLDILQLQCAEANRLLGNASPPWLRMAANKHFCKNCSEEEARLTHSSSIEHILKIEKEQAQTRLRELELLETAMNLRDESEK